MSKTPWTPISAGASDIGKPLCLYDSDGVAIALMAGRSDKEHLALAIVQRVNAHDEMAELLRVCMGSIIQEGGITPEDAEKVRALLARIGAA